MRKLIAILLVFFLSGCKNMYNHFTVGNEGFWGLVRGPAYDELIYSGTRDIGSAIWKHCHSCNDLGFIPIGIIDFPLEIAMDTITFPYDIYAWFQADELAVQAWLRSCRKRAEDGDGRAQHRLGYLYYKGEGGVEQDRQEAVKWWRKAAEQGNAQAKYELGCCYYEGEGGVEQDRQEAARLWREAAERGYAEAQYLLGFCYCEGTGGVERDEQKAVEWWRKASEQGHAKSKHKLDSCNYTAAEHSENLKMKL